MKLPVIHDAVIPAPSGLVHSGWRPTSWSHTDYAARTFDLGNTTDEVLQQINLLLADGWRVTHWLHPKLGAAEVVDGLWKSEKSTEDLLDIFLKRNSVLNKQWREWSLSFGPLEGTKGEIKSVSIMTCLPLYVPEYVIGWEGSPDKISADNLTEIVSARAGIRERPFPLGPTSVLREGVAIPYFGDVEPALNIDFEVHFLRDAVWDLTMVGKVAI